MSFMIYNPLESNVSSDTRKYDVFLSFRGEVREKIVDHLYTLLKNAFLDSKKLEKGDEISTTIKNAIEKSAIRIPIFSKNHAESHWCLEEVYYMCKSGGLIIPLFYDVSPKEVRYPDRGAFAEAF